MLALSVKTVCVILDHISLYHSHSSCCHSQWPSSFKVYPWEKCVHQDPAVMSM